MTYKAAVEEIESVVFKWEHGARPSSDAMNDVWLVLQKLKDRKEKKQRGRNE